MSTGMIVTIIVIISNVSVTLCDIIVILPEIQHFEHCYLMKMNT